MSSHLLHVPLCLGQNFLEQTQLLRNYCERLCKEETPMTFEHDPASVRWLIIMIRL